MIVVAVETSSSAMSVALFRGSELVSSLEREGRGEAIVGLIDELLRNHGVAVRDVTRWAVDIGPGSFTGVRSGVATVKGIAFATGAEIVGVTAFDALADGADAIALLDAGKGEVYYRIGAGEPGHAPLAVVRGMIAGRAEPVVGPEIAPRAEAVGRAALERAPDDLERIEPFYVRAPDLTRPGPRVS
jgi:tRNA threonylcarbamoyl adenosine modification protein YeaZ